MRLGIFVFTIITSFGLQGTPPVEQANNSGPYSAVFEQARSETDNALQLEILADDVITPEEYEQVVTAFLECMVESGYEITVEPSMSNPELPVYMSPPGLDEDGYRAYDKAFFDCSREWKSQVEMLYGSITTNPDNRDWDEITLECLQRTEVVSPSLTLEEYLQAWESGTFPNGVSIFSDDVAACVANPTNPITLPDATPTPFGE